MYDLIVVGAGPAGSRVAARMAAAGWSVLLLEEHGTPGAPVHCTGIVGEDCMSQYGVPSHLVWNTLDRFHVVAPDGTRCNVPARGSTYVLDRHGLDVWLAASAQQAGAQLATGARALHIENQADHVQVVVRYAGHDIVSHRARVGVVACGAMSDLPLRAGLGAPEAWYRTLQAEAGCQRAEGADVYLGRQFTSGSFAWVVQAGPSQAKIGLITPHHAREGYARLVDRAGLGPSPVRPRHRRMPLGAVSRSVSGRIAAVGDAAGQLKTTTGGGIYFALLCADLLAGALLKTRAGEEATALQAYERSWKARLGPELAGGMVARRAMERLSDDDLNRLVRLCRRDDVQTLMARHWHFDFHGQAMLAMASTPVVRHLRGEASFSQGWQHLLRLASRLARPGLAQSIEVR